MCIQVHLSNNNDEVDGTVFQVYCPDEYIHLPHKLIMSDNGTVSNNVRYQDLCTDKVVVNIAYNDEPGFFGNVNNTMKEWDDYYCVIESCSGMPYDFEILKTFLQTYNIEVNWIDCNFTWGVFDYDSGKWTGAVGKVNFSDHNLKTVSHIMLDTK